jgi:hypothetical protein
VTASFYDSRDSLDSVVGPTGELRDEFKADAHIVAAEARQHALDAFSAGRDEAGAAILQFAERLTLLAGGRP